MSEPTGARRYGTGGGDAYYDAVKYGGYEGTREQFGKDQAEFAQNATAVAQAKEEVEQNTQTVVNTAQTFTEETVPAAIQSVEEKGDTEEDRLEARTTELVQSINTAGAVQVQAVRDEGTTQIGLVSGAGTAQVEAVEQAGSDQVYAVELAGFTQVGNVNRAGTTQVENVNSAGTTQVQAVNTAGGNQVQAVENKGEEVLNSIPSDYTDLTEDVDNLKSAFDSSISGDYMQWSDGYFDPSGEVISPTANNEKYTTNYLPVISGETLTLLMQISSGAALWARWIFYDADKNVIGYAGQNQVWTTSLSVSIAVQDKASFFRVSFRNLTGLSKFSITRNTSIITSIMNHADGLYDGEYNYPTKWRNCIINNSGVAYFSDKGCSTDFILPTILVDYIVPLNTSYGISLCYYSDSNGFPSFVSKTSISTKTAIDKTKDYFAISIFKESTSISPSDCDDIVTLTCVVPESAEDIIKRTTQNGFKLNSSSVWSIAHQGYSEDGNGRNKKGGYGKAALRGFTHGECDVKLTSDNKLVCCHDASFVDATSGVTITIASKTLAELQACDYYGTTIATLGELIEECKKYGIKLFIDHLQASYMTYFCNEVSVYNAWDYCVPVVSYSAYAQDQVDAILAEAPNATIAILCNSFSTYTEALNYAKALENSVFYIGQYLDTNKDALKTIASLAAGTCKLVIWTVDNLSLITDVLPYLDGYSSNAWSGMDVFNPTAIK